MIKKRNSKLVALIALATLAFVTNARCTDCEQREGIESVLYRNSTKDNPGRVSLMGGAEIMVRATGKLDLYPDNNKIHFVTQRPEWKQYFEDGYLNNEPGISQNDQYSSRTRYGKLAYTVPSLESMTGIPINELWKKQGWHAMWDNNWDLETELTVETPDKVEMVCESKHACGVNFSFKYTPLLHDVVPSQVFYDQRVDFMANPMASLTAIDNGMDPVNKIKIGRNNADFEGLIDAGFQRKHWHVYNFPTYASNHEASKDTDAVMQFRTGYPYHMATMKHCLFDMSECWTIRTHPKVESINNDWGYTTGHQRLEFMGVGLNGTDITISVDDTPCEVSEISQNKLVCATQTSRASAPNHIRPGCKGLKSVHREHTVGNKAVRYHELLEGTVPYSYDEILTSSETRMNSIHYASKEITGYFRAPTTGNFRFKLSCDDQCWFFMDQTAYNPKSLRKIKYQELAARHYWSEWRMNFLENDPKESNPEHIPNTPWMRLVEGQFYPIKMYHIEFGGSDHFTVALEYEKDDASGHQHARREIQKLVVNQTNIPETFNITVMNPDISIHSSYQITIQASIKGKIKYWLSNGIMQNADAHHLKQGIEKFWRTYYKSNIQVVRYLYDHYGDPVNDDRMAHKIVYTVEVLKRIAGVSFSAANSTHPNIEITSPTQGSGPISGRFRINCPDFDGVPRYTQEMGFSSWVQGIDVALQNQIPHLSFNIHVRNQWDFKYRENGISFVIIMTGYEGPVPQCKIESGVIWPLYGNDLKYESYKLHEYGKNIQYESIPLEMLYLQTEEPEVKIEIDGLEAIWEHGNCGYRYEEPTAMIHEQSISANFLDVTVKGVNLPIHGVTVKISDTWCRHSTIRSDGSTLTCTLVQIPTAGTFNVDVFDSYGIIPVKEGIEKVTAYLKINRVHPTDGYNPEGGDRMHIFGQGFSTIASKNKITFTDGTKCRAVWSNRNRVACDTYRFNYEKLDLEEPLNVTVSVNGVESGNVSFYLDPANLTSDRVEPASASPIKKSWIKLFLSPDYPDFLRRWHFSAYVISIYDPTYKECPVYVKEVNNTEKSVTVKFPGAPVGKYKIQLNSRLRGPIDSRNFIIASEVRVHDISSHTGSRYGGQLLTIWGENFSMDPEDNPVYVVGRACEVVKTTSTELICKIPDVSTSDGPLEGEVQIQVNQIDWAESDVDMYFKFTQPTTLLSKFTTEFDPECSCQVVTVDGKHFPEYEPPPPPENPLTFQEASKETRYVYLSSSIVGGSLVDVSLEHEIEVNNSTLYGILYEGHLVDGIFMNGTQATGTIINATMIDSSITEMYVMAEGGFVVSGGLSSGSLVDVIWEYRVTVNTIVINGELNDRDLQMITVPSGVKLYTSQLAGTLESATLIDGVLKDGTTIGRRPLVEGIFEGGMLTDVILLLGNDPFTSQLSATLENGKVVENSLLDGFVIENDELIQNFTSGVLINGTFANGTEIDGPFVRGSIVDGALTSAIVLVGDDLYNTTLSVDLQFGIVLENTLADGYFIESSEIDGVFSNGTLVNGTLENGRNVSGPLIDGLFEDGLLTSVTLLEGDEPASSKLSGNITDGQFFNGVLRSGHSINSTNISGTFATGTLISGNLTDGREVSGPLEDGTFQDGHLVSVTLLEGDDLTTTLVSGKLQRGELSQITLEDGNQLESSDMHGKFEGGSIVNGYYDGYQISGSLLGGNFVDGILQTTTLLGGNEPKSTIANGNLMYGELFDLTELYGTVIDAAYLSASFTTGTLVSGTLEDGTEVSGPVEDAVFEDGILVSITLHQGDDLVNTTFSGSFMKGEMLDFALEDGHLLENSDLNSNFINGTLVNGTLEDGTEISGPIAEGNLEDGILTNVTLL